MDGGRLSQPRHCSKGVQPVPKVVHRSICCDKHNSLVIDLSKLLPFEAFLVQNVHFRCMGLCRRLEACLGVDILPCNPAQASTGLITLTPPLTLLHDGGPCYSPVHKVDPHCEFQNFWFIKLHNLTLSVISHSAQHTMWM